MGGPSPSPFGLDFGTLDLGLTIFTICTISHLVRTWGSHLGTVGDWGLGLGRDSKLISPGRRNE